MKQSFLLKLARHVLDERLTALGFRYDRGVYFRELMSGVIHIIGIGLDVRSTDTFYVMCGVNSRLMTPDKDIPSMGLVGKDVQLTHRGWDGNSGRWPCGDEASALESFSRIREMIDTLVEPYFQTKTTLSSVADAFDYISSQHGGIAKARLYKADGNLQRARQALMEYRDRLCNPKPWDDAGQLEAEKERVDAFLRDLQQR